MALGRGLESLIPSKRSSGAVKQSTQSQAVTTVQEVSINAIAVNPHQPRQQFSHQALEELINSIKQHGILQPLLVLPLKNGYQLITGERRLRAARIAGLITVPVIVRQADELQQLELALIENIQRSDLTPIEKADGYRKLMDEFGLSQEEAAKKVGVSRSTFANIVRLLELPTEVQKALTDNLITEGHAKILLGLPTTTTQLQELKNILEHKLSVRALELAVQCSTKQTHRRTAKPNLEPHLSAWQDALALKLSTKVTITSQGDRGTITIHYFSPEELANIVKKITF